MWQKLIDICTTVPESSIANKHLPLANSASAVEMGCKKTLLAAVTTYWVVLTGAQTARMQPSCV